MKKQAVLSLSGGMDSSTVLLYLLEKGYEVTAVGFDYGQKHDVELERAQQLVDYIAFADRQSKAKCSVHFIEVKSGNSKLNPPQKNIKSAILKGRVHWHEHTVDGIWKHETRKQHLNKKK